MIRSVRSTSSTRSVVCRLTFCEWMTRPPAEMLTSPAGVWRSLVVELLLIGSRAVTAPPRRRKILILQVLYCRAQLTTTWAVLNVECIAQAPGDHGKWVQIPRGAATVSGKCCFLAGPSDSCRHCASMRHGKALKQRV